MSKIMGNRSIGIRSYSQENVNSETSHGAAAALNYSFQTNHNSCYAGRWLNIQILFLLSLMWFDLWVKTSFLIEFSLSRQITRCVEALPNCFCSCPISQALPCGLHVNEWSTISTISNLFGNQINHDKHKTLGLCMHACIWWSITCK